MDLQLTGKTALISAASAGIGRATALALGREGAQTIILARRENELRALADEVAALGAPKPLVLVEDLLDPGSYDRVSSRVEEELGGVDIVVNNLGQARPFDLDTTEDEWDEAFRLNFMTPRRLATPFIQGMKDRGFGRVVCLTATSVHPDINSSTV